MGRAGLGGGENCVLSVIVMMIRSLSCVIKIIVIVAAAAVRAAAVVAGSRLFPWTSSQTVLCSVFQRLTASLLLLVLLQIGVNLPNFFLGLLL